MARLVDYNYATRWALFSINSASELSSLPTTTAGGSVPGTPEGGVTAGSIAYTNDGNFDLYTLDESDNWNAEA